MPLLLLLRQGKGGEERREGRGEERERTFLLLISPFFCDPSFFV